MESNDNQEISIDEWEIQLQTKLRELRQCQKSLNLKSCTPCSKLLECPIRDAYVHAVYNSMNKGAGGGFEF